MKFGRYYSMLAEGQHGTIQNGGAHIISFPLTCRFQVINDNTFTLGTATFQVYNLAADVRADLYKDPFEILLYKQLIFSAGYQNEPDKVVQIFQGNIIQCYSYRQGGDWITEIVAADGSWMQDNATIDLSIQNGYSFKYIAQKLVEAMSPTVQVGLISSLITSEAVNTRGLTLSGSPFDLLVRQTTPRKLTAYIYQEKCHILTQSEYISVAGGVKEISNDTGILGSPKMQAYQVIVRMIFEPKIVVQQNIQLKTIQNSRMSGPYLVARVTHRGTISGAVCEDLVTEVNLYRPNADALKEAA